METVIAAIAGVVLVVVAWSLARVPLHPRIVLATSRVGRLLFWMGFSVLLVMMLGSIWLLSSRWLSTPFALLITFGIELLVLELIIRLVRFDPPSSPHQAPAHRVEQQTAHRLRRP